MSRARDLVALRVMVRVTVPERDELAARCRAELRTVASWFRVQIRRAWRARGETPTPARASSRRRKQVDGVQRHAALWARVRGEERAQLDILAAEEGVSLSIWFRRRLDAELARPPGGEAVRSAPGDG